MSAPEDLPYRPCVGVALFNRAGLVWVGRRSDANAEGEGAGHWWQMPQGGLDDDEAPEKAVFRELYEETSIRSVKLIREAGGVAEAFGADVVTEDGVSSLFAEVTSALCWLSN